VPAGLRARLRERLPDLARRTRKISADLGCMHVELTWHPASRDADMYSSDPRHGTMRGHAIAAAEAIRLLGAHLAAGGGPHLAAEGTQTTDSRTTDSRSAGTRTTDSRTAGTRTAGTRTAGTRTAGPSTGPG
jgi:hypothetical protein